MQFSDVVGQAEIKQQLRHMLEEERVPHALLFAGPEGTGKLPMALALAQRLLCTSPTAGNEACGQCKGCHMAAKLAHPDLHFVFPVFKPSGQNAPAVSDQFLAEWRAQVNESPYFTRQEWLQRIGIDNQQSLINVSEAANIMSKLVTTSSQGGRRVVVVWSAEQMNTEAANKLLKILEEPPAYTHFILTAARPERLLATILSRTQRIDFGPVRTADMQVALQNRCGLQPEDARFIARASDGNFIKALEQVTMNADTAQFFDMFVLLMRLCYMRKIKDLHEWSENVAKWGREKQKSFLEYCQRLVRENFIYNFHEEELNYMNRDESNFSVNFARFINERNVIGISDELAAAQRDIEQNVNPRMVFFDFTLKMIVLLIQ